MDPRTEFAHGALHEVAWTKSVHDVEEVTTVAGYEPDKLKVLRGGTRPLGALGLLTGPARESLADPQRFTVAACGARTTAAVGLPTEPLSDWKPLPPPGRHLGVNAPFLDNGNVMAGTPEGAHSLLNEFKKELFFAGFLLHGNVEPTHCMEPVG